MFPSRQSSETNFSNTADHVRSARPRSTSPRTIAGRGDTLLPVSVLAGCSRCGSRLRLKSHPIGVGIYSCTFTTSMVRLRTFSVQQVSASPPQRRRTNLLGGGGLHFEYQDRISGGF